MSRKIRGPVAGRLVEVTTRTFQSRFLLRPSPRLRTIAKGVFARAQARYDMKVCAKVTASNHVQGLLVPDSSKQLAQFMRYVNSNLARKIGKLYGWKGRFWQRRYTAIVVSDEEAAQVARLEYLLAHGVKENLVAHPADWPGVQFVAELCAGYDSVSGGVWEDESASYEARRQGRPVNRRDFESRHEIELSPLPCWQGLSRTERAMAIRALVRGIVERAREARRCGDLPEKPLGARRVCEIDPHYMPEESKSSPAPPVHAASRAVRSEMIAAYRRFVAAFRQAAELLQRGALEVEFPPGSFPPGLPWVPEPRPGPA